MPFAHVSATMPGRGRHKEVAVPGAASEGAEQVIDRILGFAEAKQPIAVPTVAAISVNRDPTG
jgi:hypothetical protein